MKKPGRPTWCEIDLDALAFNLHSVRKFIEPGIKVMAMVKADAYGHGAIECSRRLEVEGIDWLGVAMPEEGAELRKSGVSKPILCLGGFWAGQETLMITQNLTPVVYQIESAEMLNRAASSRRTAAPIHVKIDTGMGRVGIRYDEVDALIEKLAQLRNLRVEGLMTHFAAADDIAQNEFTDLQIERFYDVVAKFRAKGFDPECVDLANSPGAVAHPKSLGNMVRLGGILYGLAGDVFPAGVPLPELQPVMSLRSKITHIKKVPAGETLGYGRTFKTSRESIIATIPVGYEDGYRRMLSNRSHVIINGRSAPVVGRVSMDWTIIDVTDIPESKIGDVVTLIGRDGDLKLTAEGLAGLCSTISYEITCGINRRVTKVFKGSA
jgi:alanine racemase